MYKKVTFQINGRGKLTLDEVHSYLMRDSFDFGDDDDQEIDCVDITDNLGNTYTAIAHIVKTHAGISIVDKDGEIMDDDEVDDGIDELDEDEE